MSMNRREMLVLTGVAAVGACLGNCLSALAADLPTPPAKLDIGTAADYAAEGMFDKFAATAGVIVVRKGRHIHACSAVCTHRKNMLKLVNGELRCPAHGSRFTPEGEASKGPAKEPLIRYAMSKNADQHLIVDTTRSFAKESWNDSAAFVEVI